MKELLCPSPVPSFLAWVLRYKDPSEGGQAYPHTALRTLHSAVYPEHCSPDLETRRWHSERGAQLWISLPQELSPSLGSYFTSYKRKLNNDRPLAGRLCWNPTLFLRIQNAHTQNQRVRLLSNTGTTLPTLLYTGCP